MTVDQSELSIESAKCEFTKCLVFSTCSREDLSSGNLPSQSFALCIPYMVKPLLHVCLLQIRQDARISRVEGGLEVRGVTVWDTGAYTCELEADMETHVARTHHLQVLGG